MRIGKDELGLLLARSWSLRGTCGRRRVGCVLMDADGYPLSAGYNGPASGQDHCTDSPCRGFGLAPGTGLDICEAIHAEANALLRCPDVRRVFHCYSTHSPCIGCVKLLMNSGCQRIVFAERYAHDGDASRLWQRHVGHGATGRWVHLEEQHVPMSFGVDLAVGTGASLTARKTKDGWELVEAS